MLRRKDDSREPAQTATSGMRREVFQYIETSYNTVRLYSALGYVSPTTFEQQQVA
ncbi:MAG: hypothetical protein GKR94_13085 [Gammaproteobacteria bacterium]|nr:hypothetical protein [Gammaproteobacteria bacterium]